MPRVASEGMEITVVYVFCAYCPRLTAKFFVTFIWFAGVSWRFVAYAVTCCKVSGCFVSFRSGS